MASVEGKRAGEVLAGRFDARAGVVNTSQNRRGLRHAAIRYDPLDRRDHRVPDRRRKGVRGPSSPPAGPGGGRAAGASLARPRVVGLLGTDPTGPAWPTGGL